MGFFLDLGPCVASTSPSQPCPLSLSASGVHPTPTPIHPGAVRHPATPASPPTHIHTPDRPGLLSRGKTIELDLPVLTHNPVVLETAAICTSKKTWILGSDLCLTKNLFGICDVFSHSIVPAFTETFGFVERQLYARFHSWARSLPWWSLYSTTVLLKWCGYR